MKKRDIVKALKQQGFELKRVNSHEIYSDGKTEVTVPHHAEINEYTAKAILKKAGVL